MPYKVDLHVHTAGSPDGSLGAANLERMFASGGLHCIAITDHDTIDRALEIQKQFGTERIIVGEEITTLDGEMIGLFLKKAVLPGQSAIQTAEQIKTQGGLVYIPHPFETVRKGMRAEVLEQILPYIDIVETHNGRAMFQNYGRTARFWAEINNKAMVASSDAHGVIGWGRTCSILEAMPNQKTLVPLLRTATLIRAKVGFPGVLYPKFNRLRKRIKKHA